MAFSEIDICNMALGHLGRTNAPIQSFGEKSAEARTCALWYEPCRRELLEIYDWSFARRRVSLALHSDPPPRQWGYRYQVPSGILAFRYIWNPFSQSPPSFFPGSSSFFLGMSLAGYQDLSDALPWEFELSLDGQSKTIVTNQGQAEGVYTGDTSLVQMFSGQFVNAFTHLLAGKMGYQITGKMAVEDKEAKAFTAALRVAAASDANQGVAPPQRDASSIRARF